MPVDFFNRSLPHRRHSRDSTNSRSAAFKTVAADGDYRLRLPTATATSEGVEIERGIYAVTGGGAVVVVDDEIEIAQALEW